ncbi:lipase family protein [Marinomonas spartinae]|uniref:lipase family protein n=1 Tax=Marinomonas spartinae TaxID=1792290 RepID=UPI00082B46F7
MRGTAKNRDAITDLNYDLSTCSNNQPVHVGFNHTFNSFKGQLERYFSQYSQGELKMHVVGHSLLLDLIMKKEGNGIGCFI